MIDYETGGLVRSLAGHDKGQYFVILAEQGEYVTLVDGKARRLDKPKRKSKKHIQVIHYIEETLNKKIAHGEHVTDEEVRFAIRCYKKSHRGV